MPYYLIFYVFVSSAITFIFHRVLIFDLLSDHLSSKWVHRVEAFFVGVASDVWVASLWMFLFWICFILSSRIFSSMVFSLLARLFLGLQLLVLSLHYSYVEFFRVPIMPSHLSYITDVGFWKGNGNSLWQPVTIVSALGIMGLYIISGKICKILSAAEYRRLILGLIFVLGVGAHVFHIKYRVQWFVPEALQFNIYENLYALSHQQQKSAPLTVKDFVTLGVDLSFGDSLDKVFFARSERDRASDHGMLVSLKNKLQALIVNKEKPLIITLLWESFRAIDSQSYSPGQTSLTPEFDRLATKGLLFKNAWSTGTVTRAGQEAVWCGYPSAIGRSLMREFSHISYACLPDLLQVKKAHLFWYHGGEGRFDNQEMFWRAHGVRDVMTRADFSADTPGTGWGVGDVSFLQSAGTRLVANHAATQAPFLFGMLLTVTHHIPWTVPNDQPAEVRDFLSAGAHPSERTLVYSDYAVGALVRELKAAGLWDKTLLVILGDHGMRAKALQSQETDPSPAVQASKIGFLLSGGIAETVATEAPSSWFASREPVSQMDVASFYAHILDVEDFRGAGSVLFRSKRRWPVFVQLGQSVFFPEIEQEIRLSEMLSKDASQFDPPSLGRDVLYVRALFGLVDSWSLVKKSF